RPLERTQVVGAQEELRKDRDVNIRMLSNRRDRTRDVRRWVAEDRLELGQERLHAQDVRTDRSGRDGCRFEPGPASPLRTVARYGKGRGPCDRQCAYARGRAPAPSLTRASHSRAARGEPSRATARCWFAGSANKRGYSRRWPRCD